MAKKIKCFAFKAVAISNSLCMQYFCRGLLPNCTRTL